MSTLNTFQACFQFSSIPPLIGRNDI